MGNWILISLVLTTWSGWAVSYGPRTSGIQTTKNSQTYYRNQYNTSYEGWNQPVYFPEDTGSTSNSENSQTYYRNQYNTSNEGWNQSGYFPQDTGSTSNSGNEASQTFVDYRYDPNYSNLISSSILELAHKLGTQLESHGTSKSQIFSPISIASALSLLLLGSRGQTHQELLQLFALDQNPLYTSKPYKIHEELGLMVEDLLENNIHPSRMRPQPSWKFTYVNDHMRGPQMRGLNTDEYIIRVANGIFIQNGFSLRPDYKTVVEQVYKSEITPLDFASNSQGAQNYINGWVNDKTHGKIPTIISEKISADTTMIIASALYFKALWETEFLQGATTLSDFYPDGLDGPSIKAQIMANGGEFPFYDAREYGCRIIGLPYKKYLSTMYIIMPNDSNRTQLRDLQAQLTADKIEYMISRMTKKTALIALPKLHIQNTINLKYFLSEMGVKTIFSKGLSDLSLISDSPSGGVQFNNFRNVRPFLSDSPLIFTRIGEEESRQNTTSRSKRTITYKVESSLPRSSEPLRLKDFILNKRITKLNPGKKRNRRQVVDPSNSIRSLDELRKVPGIVDPQLFVEEVVHKVDLVVNERGTEGGAATVAYLRRSGPEVLFRADTPFMLLVQHDPTKLPLFYGTVYEPVE